MDFKKPDACGGKKRKADFFFFFNFMFDMSFEYLKVISEFINMFHFSMVGY